MTKDLYILQLELGGMANFSYLVGDTSSGEAAVVDPHDETDEIEKAAAAAGLTIKSVLLTHGHYDHVGGLKYYADKKGLPVYLSKDEFMLYIPRCKTLKKISGGDKLTVGKFRVDCIHTPGHTPGCVCFLVEGNLFTGDTLFVDAIGRTDLPGGNTGIMFQSLQTLKKLPPETIIWPGHDYGAVRSADIKTLLKKNPYLACGTKEEFLGLT